MKIDNFKKFLTTINYKIWNLEQIHKADFVSKLNKYCNDCAPVNTYKIPQGITSVQEQLSKSITNIINEQDSKLEKITSVTSNLLLFKRFKGENCELELINKRIHDFKNLKKRIRRHQQQGQFLQCELYTQEVSNHHELQKSKNNLQNKFNRYEKGANKINARFKSLKIIKLDNTLINFHQEEYKEIVKLLSKDLS